MAASHTTQFNQRLRQGRELCRDKARKIPTKTYAGGRELQKDGTQGLPSSTPAGRSAKKEQRGNHLKPRHEPQKKSTRTPTNIPSTYPEPAATIHPLDFRLQRNARLIMVLAARRLRLREQPRPLVPRHERVYEGLLERRVKGCVCFGSRRLGRGRQFSGRCCCARRGRG